LKKGEKRGLGRKEKMFTLKELSIKPFLTYSLPERKEAISWRSWGGVQTKQDLNGEVNRINKELNRLSSRMNFPHRILPLTSVGDVKDIDDGEINNSSDVILVYAAGGRVNLLEKLTSYNKPVVFFIRHRSGPVYLWYEVIHPVFLRGRTDEVLAKNVGVDDIVVDDYDEILWKMRSLYGLKNTIGERIIAVGGPGGWGLGASIAPYLARKKWSLDIVNYPYSELGKRIKKEKSNKNAMDKARTEAEKYLKQKGITLKTNKDFVVNAFVLYKIFKDLLNEYDSEAITINECMGTIINLSKTTACLPLSLLNDEGYLAFCESDFVVIPSGILLHHISDRPVFLNDPTTPHHGIVTLAHCTAPRKMNGKDYEPTKIVTHMESDYGAAPKVEFKKGVQVTVIDPDFSGEKWIGFKGKITDIPFLPICRSQMDIEIEGDWQKLLREMRGFHWMLSYGDYLKEVGYALKKNNIDLETI
jgi:hypothetical protein